MAIAAAEHYARKHRMGEEAIGYAQTIKIDAMAMLGTFLDDGPKATGGDRKKVKGSSSGDSRVPLGLPPTINDMGLTKRESADSKLLSKVKEESPADFESIRTGAKKLTQMKRERPRRTARSRGRRSCSQGRRLRMR